MSIPEKQDDLGVRRGKNLQKGVCREKQLSISETRKSEVESGDSEQAGEVIDGQVHRQVNVKALSGFTGHARKDSVLQFPAEMTLQVGHCAPLPCNYQLCQSLHFLVLAAMQFGDSGNHFKVFPEESPKWVE